MAVQAINALPNMAIFWETFPHWLSWQFFSLF
jgi:hypothetical protein